jgi:hypothetical protein
MTVDKKIFLILIAFVLTFHSTAQTSKSNDLPVSYDRNKKYSVENLHFDLAILKDALVKTHPGLYRYQSEKEFEDNYTLLKNSISGTMTETEFYNLVTSFVANIKCGHTDTDMSEKFYKYGLSKAKVFPFGIKIIEEKIYLQKNYTTDTTVALGAQIISINGISADSILHFMQAQQWTDGFIKSYNRIEHFFQTMLLGFLNYPERYVLNIKDMNGNSKLTTIEALDYKIYEEREKRYAPDSNPKNKPFRFRVIDSLSTGIVDIDGFYGIGYNKFLARTFKTLKNKKYKNLIIDLRGNSGGDGQYPVTLYSYITLKEFRASDHMEMTIDNPNDTIFKYGKLPYNGRWRFKHFYKYKLKETENGVYELKSNALKELRKKPLQPRKNNFTGNVFILIDIKSYSASSHFSAIAYYNKRAKFIGRETGGAYCGDTSGWEFSLTLPRTGIQVYIPLIKGYNAVEGICGRGIIPDYPLKEDIKNVILNKDVDLLFTLNLISRTK